ncbi:acyl-CoA dehydrogenase, partial [bacterium]|nr:acyl-CoA dehydrogenase [bacterium]
MSDFFQSPPVLQNPYLSDTLIQTYLKRTLPTHLLMEIEPELKQLGTRVVHEIETLGIQAEAQPPVHIPFDPWGRRIDHIKVSEAWRRLEEIAVEEKLIAIAYDRTQGEYSRIFQFSKVYLYG